MNFPEQAVLAAMALCVLGAAITRALGRHPRLVGWVAFGVVAISSCLVVSGATRVLLSGAGRAQTFLAVPALGFALRLYVDGLSAVFLGLIAVVAVPAALYSIDYMAHPHRGGLGRYYANLLLFVAAMYGLVSTTDMMWFFFIFWQLMTLTGYGLIRHERRNPDHARAAFRYLLMMQLACALTMVGAAMLAREAVTTPGGETLMRYDFDAVSHHLAGRFRSQGTWVAAAFAMFLAGFGIKLGMWPFGQVWLPDAHPAAPSPVSALLSGVMIKTGVYGLMRYFLWLVPAEAAAEYPVRDWGLLVVGLGTVTLLTGTVQALRQDLSKRLLAFSSIGQGGYILFGLGTCMVLVGSPVAEMRVLAATAFGAALLHTLNHAVFKSLLFLNAGSVLRATGTQDLNQIGGLMRFMPLTAVTALIASLAIAGVPLFSGFVSKWHLSVAAILGGPAARVLPACALIAILTSAITLALFIKFFGVLFLARRSALVTAKAANAASLEVPVRMRLAQAGLAAVVLLAGLFPAVPLAIVQRALQTSRQGLGVVLADASVLNGGVWHGLGAADGASRYAPLVLAAVAGLLYALALWLMRAGQAPRRPAVPWLCGYATESEANRYRARHLYAELVGRLRWLGGATRAQDSPTPQAAPPLQKEESLKCSLEKN